VATAYLDESARYHPDGSLYVVTAALVADAAKDAVRTRMRGLLLPGQRRLHWREESPARQTLIIDAVAQLDPTTLACAVRPVAPHHQERARARCLTRLLWELIEHRVTHLVFESRDESLNNRDAVTIANARRAGQAPEDMAFDFGDPNEEPLLWLPDAIAGAAGAHIIGEGSEHFQTLPTSRRLVILDP
jgi:hypothetical protein